MTDVRASLSPEYLAFWRERHLCTVTTLRPDGSLHVTPMGIVIDEQAGCAWGITSRHSRKVRNIRAAGDGGAAIAVCQIDGRRWATIEGHAEVLEDGASVGEAEARYARRYRVPRPNPDRVAVRITIERTMGNVPRPEPGV